MEVICLRWRYDEARFELLKYRDETSGFEKQIDQIWHQLLPIRNFEVHLRCEILLLFALLQNKTKFLDSEYYKYQGS